MKERGIIMQAESVQGTLSGRKTQTRRIVKGAALEWLEPGMFTREYVASPENHLCPYGQPGDRLWVRETWTETINIEGIPDWPDRPCTLVDDDPSDVVIYRADGEWEWLDNDGFMTDETHWKPSIFMPRWASRILLEIVAVRVERLQDISEEDAKAEGCFALGDCECTAVRQYREIWESINGAGSWEENPWVWVVEFKRIEA